MTGHVTLVGAGPGDIGLLTLSGAQALREADAVVFDRLVGAEVLALAPASAERIDAGKQSGNHTLPQEQINELLVALAREGKQVVRLKGGDCYLFGRGGEEADALAHAGIPFTVVPGVTSALAAPAYAGIPVTHRDYCSSVHLVTAHAKAGSRPAIDFESLARLSGTIVFLMGVHALPMLMEGLLAAGMDADTPAAVIENGTRADQRKLVGTISTLAVRAVQEKIQSPALIVVGAVCALHTRLDWFSARPLCGKRVVVTRPRERAGTLCARLRAQGAEVIEYPCIETEQTPKNHLPRDLTPFSWAVLTSPVGARAALAALQDEGRDFRALGGLRFACIGRATADALASFGIIADFVPEQFSARALAHGLCARMECGQRALLLRAEEGTPELTEILSAHGVAYEEAAVYRTVYRAEQSEALSAQIAAGRVDFAAFTSASTVRGFIGATPAVDVTRFTAVCIGEATAAAAKKYGMRVRVAKNATVDAMMDCMMEGI